MDSGEKPGLCSLSARMGVVGPEAPRTDMPDPVELPIVVPRRWPTRLVGRSRLRPPLTLDEKLDQALADSFPASDPVSFIEPAPQRKADR